MTTITATTTSIGKRAIVDRNNDISSNTLNYSYKRRRRLLLPRTWSMLTKRTKTRHQQQGVGDADDVDDDDQDGQTTGVVDNNYNNKEVQLARNLLNIKTRYEALNELLQITSSHEMNYALTTDIILQELIHIGIHDCFQWTTTNDNVGNDNGINDDDDNNDNIYNDNYNDSNINNSIVFRSKVAWKYPPTKRMDQWICHCSNSIIGANSSYGDDNTTKNTSSNFKLYSYEERMKLLEVIVVIFRNLSFVGNNIRLLVYTPEVICILLGCMSENYNKTNHVYNDNSNNNSNGITNTTNNPRRSSTSSSDSSSSLRITTIALTALQTLLNLVRYLDVTGQVIFCDKLFYNDQYVETIKSATTPCPPVPTSSSTSAFGLCSTSPQLFGLGAMWLARKLDPKEDTMSDIQQPMLVSMVGDYLVAVYSIFPILCQIVINPRTTRPTILASLDFLQELINLARIGIVGDVKHDDDDASMNQNDTAEDNKLLMADDMPTLREILVNMPECLLQRLIHFLYIPRLGPDSLDYIDPVKNIVTRVTALKLIMGYDATIDPDVRDRSLEILVPLLELDMPRMAYRIGTIAKATPTNETIGSTTMNKVVYSPRIRLFDSLMPILTTTTGRNDASTLATQLLRELSRAASFDNEHEKDSDRWNDAKNSIRIGFLYIKDRIIELASRDQRISHLVWNDLYRIPDDEGEDYDDDDDDNENEYGMNPNNDNDEDDDEDENDGESD